MRLIIIIIIDLFIRKEKIIIINFIFKNLSFKPKVKRTLQKLNVRSFYFCLLKNKKLLEGIQKFCLLFFLGIV
jgi:hypothetical protein